VFRGERLTLKLVIAGFLRKICTYRGKYKNNGRVIFFEWWFKYLTDKERNSEYCFFGILKHKSL
jgi:hypothetical protein